MKAMLLNVVGQTRHGAVDVADLVEARPRHHIWLGAHGGRRPGAEPSEAHRLSLVATHVGLGADAATAVNRFSSDIARERRPRSRARREVKNSDGTLRDPGRIIADMMEKSKGHRRS